MNLVAEVCCIVTDIVNRLYSTGALSKHSRQTTHVMQVNEA